MDWTWRTATETNVNDVETNPTSIPEVYCEVSFRTQSHGNGVAAKETHSNAVAGGATATAVTQPPLDNTLLASLHLNKQCHMRCTSGQLQHSVLLSHQPPKISSPSS